MGSVKPPVLIVGTGFGCRIPIPALRAAGFDVVGLVGTDAKRTAERAAANGVARSFTDLDEAITRTSAVAVTVATTPFTHAPLTLAAISRGCHVLCEKPFAKNVAEARSMLDAAERAGVAHLVGHEFRWTTERALAARAIADGQIGDPKFIMFAQSLQYLTNPQLEMPEWLSDAESGGGVLGMVGSHMVDWVRYMVGEFESLSAATATVSKRKAEDSYIVRFRLTNGAEGVLQQSYSAWGPPVDVVRVIGTKGSVWLENKGTAWLETNTAWIADSNGARALPIPQDLVLPPLPPLTDDPRHKTQKWQMLVQAELPPYIKLCEAWRAMIEGKQPSNVVRLPTFADGVASIEVLDAVRTSAANGGALVKIPVRT